MNRLNQIEIIYFISIIMLSCTNPHQHMNLHNGDILFCSYGTGELSGAIDSVTQTEKLTHYSHMALIEIVSADTFVIHASLKRGVVKEPLSNFLLTDQPLEAHIYRLVDSLQHTIPQALIQANSKVGLPYNSHYRMNDTCYYCSQLVYDAFKADSIFKLEPMTFKNSETNEFNEAWVNHYNALGLPIPEGEPGCNPNGLAASNKLQFVGRLK